MNSFTITLEIPGLAEALTRLADAFKASAAQTATKPEPTRPQLDTPQPTPVAVPAPINQAPNGVSGGVDAYVAQIKAPPAPPVVPTATAPTYSRDQIMTAGAALIDAGKITELMRLLNAFGVQAVTQLKQDQLGAFATELRKLGAQI